jgi:hypothetical protein
MLRCTYGVIDAIIWSLVCNMLLVLVRSEAVECKKKQPQISAEKDEAPARAEAEIAPS